MVTKNEGRYLPDAQLRAMRRKRMTLDEIVEANYQATGFRPDRGNLSLKLRSLGAAGRRYRVLLQHWTIRPEHHTSRWQYMLSAKSRELDGETLTDAERRAVNLLEFLLNPTERYLDSDGALRQRKRGKHFVVAYHSEVGFCLVDARPGERYIRIPDEEQDCEAPEVSDRNGLELVR